MENKKEFTQEEQEYISIELEKQLGPEFLSQRPGPSGRNLTYIEGKTAINIANEIFGFNGWNSQIKDTTIDFVDVSEDNRYSIGVSVTTRVTLKDGTYHEDIGYGYDQNAKSKGAAFEKARKQAVTDATKRTLRYFGNSLGNCLYDNSYLNGIGKMAKPTIKFAPSNLYRHSQYQPKQKPVPKLAESKPTHIPQLQPQAQTHISTVKPTVKPEPSTNPTNNSNNLNKTSTPDSNIEYQSAALVEPLVHEDSFIYEGDDDCFDQVFGEDEFPLDEEILAGLTSPPPKSVPGSQDLKEPRLSDVEHRKKRSRNSQEM